MEKKFINGFEVCLLPDNRFKTATFTIYIRTPLDESTAAKNAVLPAVLMRGCAAFPETKDLNIRLEELYGASCSFNISKQGAYQVLALRFRTVADRFAEGEAPFLKLIEFASEILFNPLVSENKFRESYVEREKENLKIYLAGVVNDKRKYAAQRLIEEMCKGEEFSINENGTPESVDAVNAENLYAAYLSLLESADISFYFAEQFDSEAVKNALKNILPACVEKERRILLPKHVEKAEAVRYTEEKAPVTQGKLSMGFRSTITRTSPRFYAMMVFDALFGASPYSKLFLNVREKLSLAYYASSRFVSVKGILMVSSGIEFKNFDAAKNEILVQLDEMKKGNFTQADISAAKLDLTDALRGVSDTGAGLANFYASLAAIGVKDTIESVIEGINKVEKTEIIDAANSLTLDTVYFLKGEE
ncbi:MAG: insulinase family protein [Clostridia bacterium]|nr:insulinase family protein [Clostridia bacterium]